MALNFRIFHQQKRDNLHLSLSGDFDGSSALELINTLNEHRCKVKKIVIHTSRLSSLHPFGLSVFRKRCANNDMSHALAFSGKYSRQMAFKKSQFTDSPENRM